VNRFGTVGQLIAAGLLAGGVFLSAQAPQVPEPRRQFGASITPVYEGWFYNADGSRSFLIGYYNRNSRQELDIPIGPNNRFEPGGPDMGQPTHFMPGRQWGIFIVPAPREFKPTDSYTWTLSANGQTTSIPFRLHPDYVMAPFSEIAVGNTPPAIRFEQNGKTVQGPLAQMSAAPARTASVGTPFQLDIWASDDMKFTSGTNAPMSTPRPPVTLTVSKYRGPGTVKVDKAKPAVEKIADGGAPFNGKAATTVTFSEPGDYVLHVIANDYSGDGGQGFGCCWTTALVKITVK
jgi:hypothetical protein